MYASRQDGRVKYKDERAEEWLHGERGCGSAFLGAFQTDERNPRSLSLSGLRRMHIRQQANWNIRGIPHG